MKEILAVDDSRVNLALLRAILEGEGYRMHEATSIAAARTVLKERSVQLVMLDVVLPDGSGLQLVREIRLDPRTSTLPVVGLSANAFPEARAEALAAGCNTYLTKPFQFAELTAVVSSLAARPTGRPH